MALSRARLCHAFALGCAAAVAGGCEGAGDPVFTEETHAIDIRWSSFWEGGYRLQRTREQLSNDQLRLVKRIRTVPSSDECWEDAAEASVEVTGGGQPRGYHSNEYNGSCGRDVTMVDYEAVAAFLDTVNCLSAQGYDGSRLDAAPNIAPDDGCLHGLFNSSGTTPRWWFRVEIERPGEYRAAVDECRNRDLSLAFLDEDGERELAKTEAADGVCPSLVYRFAEPGTYVLKVDMHAGTHAGDFFLRFDSTTAR